MKFVVAGYGSSRDVEPTKLAESVASAADLLEDTARLGRFG
jgi:hypothetical protein